MARKNPRTVAALGFLAPISFSVLLVGKSTAHGYNAPCFEGMVHYCMGSVLMGWDTADGKDRI